MVFLSKLLRQYQVPQVIALLLLVALVVIGAAPSYLAGQWPWAKPPQVTTLKQLRNLRQQGLVLPGWKALNHQVVQIGGHKWLYQEIQRDPQTTVVLLLRPQNDHTDQPEVEWTDVNWYQQQLTQQWTTDSYRHQQFTITSVALNPLTETTLPAQQTASAQAIAKVEAQFFRGWNQQQTYAILQWYAWPGGGHPAPSHWFWVDRSAQLSSAFGQSRGLRRVPWVAVSILVPIEPLGDIEAAWPTAQSLGQTVQAALMASPLSLNSGGR
jgi:cyanoexosortase B-associated protein